MVEQKHSIIFAGALGTGGLLAQGGGVSSGRLNPTFFWAFLKGLRGLSIFDTYAKGDDIDRLCLVGSVFCLLAVYSAPGWSVDGSWSVVLHHIVSSTLRNVYS